MEASHDEAQPIPCPVCGSGILMLVATPRDGEVAYCFECESLFDAREVPNGKEEPVSNRA